MNRIKSLPAFALLLAYLRSDSCDLLAEGTRMKHPVLNHSLRQKDSARLEDAIRRVMAMKENEMLRLIPDRSAVIFCGCPNCTGGSQECNQFEWSIDRPFELRCRHCKHVFPSDKYLMTQTETGVNALGETVAYRYYFDEKAGRDYWFEAHADYLRRAWFVEQCLLLAQAYHVTQKPEYARRAALILNHFAKSYPHLAVLYQWPYQRRAVVKPEPPYPDTGGKWGRWMEDEVPAHLPEAFDLIYDSEELDKLATQEKTNVRQRIENDFFRATIAYLFTFGKEPSGRHLNNMAYTYTRNIIYIGRTIGETEFVHWGHRWVRNMLQDGFMVDGMWHEAPSYHYQTINGIRIVMATLKGYSDPPGYQSPDGARLENVDLETQLPFVQKALRAPDLIAYPDGRICPVHDTWAGEKTSRPREQTTSTLLPGFGHASLGRGLGPNQLQAQLHFSGGYGHQHADNLHFSLFAKGREMLSDLGYTHTKLRQWTISTHGHNTVLINRQGQTALESDGDLLLFMPGLQGMAVVEARGERGYPGLAEVYRRTLILVPVSESDAYLVDLFRVKGGEVHDWLLHGSADEDMTAGCSLKLLPKEGTMLEPGEEWKEPIGEFDSFSPYGLMREVRMGRTAKDFRVTFQTQEEDGKSANTSGSGVRTRLLGGRETEVFLARSPRIRQAENDDRKVYDSWMPQLVVRRQGSAPLTSVFAAVHEPFLPKPFIRRVRRLPLDPSTDFAVALEVQCRGFTDTIISTHDEPPFPERRLPGDIRVQGRLAILRKQRGRGMAAWLVDGARLEKGSFGLAVDTPRCEGSIEAVQRKADGAPADAFITSAVLPEGDALAGQWLIVTHGSGHTHGYEIARVTRTGKRSLIILKDDPGLRITGDQTEELCFPRRRFSGPNRFFLSSFAAWRKK